MAYKIDDNNHYAKPQITVNEYGTWRADGKTERERLKEYREKYGEKRYLKLKEEIERAKNAQN